MSGQARYSGAEETPDDRTILRLEEALDRIEQGIGRREQAFRRMTQEAAAREDGKPELAEIAANLDALCARLRGVLDRRRQEG